MTDTRLALRIRSILVASFVLCFSHDHAFGANLDAVADHVLGQSSFNGNSANQGATVSASGLNQPNSIAIDRRSGRIWVADTLNHRVLSYPSAASMSNGQPADFVLGQPTLTSNTANNGGLSASSLNFPKGVAIDVAGNIYVSDSGNNRVLMFTQPLTTDATADIVIGQAGFASSTAGTSKTTLNGPARMSFDRDRNLFLADTLNNRVLAYVPPFTNGMNAALVLGQLDFNSNTANVGGLSASSLSVPSDVAFDSNDNVYVADTANNRVLEYDIPYGNHASATRVYGQANSFTTNTPNKNGLGITSLSGPAGITFDPSKGLYVTDSGNNRVVRYPATGSPTNVFGQPDFFTNTVNTGGVGANSASGPLSTVSDNSGNLLIADTNNNRLLEYDFPLSIMPAVTTLFPALIAAGSSDFTLYVGDSGLVNASVVRVNEAPRQTSFVSFASVAALVQASDIAVPGSLAITVMTPPAAASNLLPLTVYNRVPNDTIADRFWGQPDFATGNANSGGLSAHSFVTPYDVAIDINGRMWVSDFFNYRILSWPNAEALTNGKDADFVLGQKDFVTNPLSGTATSSSFADAAGIFVDPAGNVYVADSFYHRVLIFNDPLHTDKIADVVLGQADFVSGASNKGGAVSSSSLFVPYAINMDASGNLYVADSANNRVLRFTPPFVTNMNASRVFGQPDFNTGTANTGGAGATTLGNPTHVAFDSLGNLYIADFGNSRVLEYDSPSTSDTVADRVFGQPDFTSIAPNFTASATGMNNPVRMAFDASDNLYVSDRSSNRILVFNSPLTSNGAASKVFGQGGSFVSNTANNGGRGAGTLNAPVGLAFDAKYNLYACDYLNNRVLCYDHPAQNSPALTAAAKATPDSVVLGQPVNFTVTAIDPDKDPLTYTWDFGDGITGAGSSVNHSYQLIGTITVKVTVSDGFGGIVTSSVMVTVTPPPNNPPVLTSAAQATPANVSVGQPVNFTVAASDPDNDALDFVWDFGDGCNGVGASIKHVYLVPGTMMATVTIDDGRGGAVSSMVAVTVKSPDPDNPPVFTQMAQAAPSSVLLGQAVNFTAAGSDPDNDALNFVWDFGDGTSGIGPAVSHIYLLAGTLTAKVTLDDGRDGMVSSTAMVTVKAPQPLGDVKLSVKLNFVKPNADAISASGTVVLAPGDLIGKLATVQIADLIETFTIGKSVKNADGSFGLSSKGTAARAAKFKLKLGKKTFAPSLVSAGFANATVNAQVHVPVTLTLDTTVYQTIVTHTYSAKVGKSGKTK